MTKLSHYMLSAAAGTALLTLLSGAATAGPVLIDSFDDTQIITQNTVGTSSGSVGAGASPNIIGGERDVILTVGSDVDGPGINQAQVSVNTGGNSLANYINDADVSSTLEFQYDGADASSSLDATGLGGVDLTMGGDNDGILFEIEFSDLPVQTTISIYSDAANFSEAQVSTPGMIFSGSQQFYVDFSEFSAAGGTGADLTSVGAMTFLFDGPPGLDVRMDLIGAVEEIPEPTTPLIMGLAVLGLGIWSSNRRKRRGLS